MPKKVEKSKTTLYSKSIIDSKFWESKTLDALSKEEWEAVCDGCGKCCLHKFIEDDGVDDGMSLSDEPVTEEELHYTNIACYLFDENKCACTDYRHRSSLVPDCVTLSPENLDAVYFMPASCSYRRLNEGRGLASWHPLLNNGSKAKMHKKGISAKGKTVNEKTVNLQDFEDYIVLWPLHDSI